MLLGFLCTQFMHPEFLQQTTHKYVYKSFRASYLIPNDSVDKVYEQNGV